MNRPDITASVVGQLKNRRRHDDIILEVCERTGMQWSDAQQFVQRVYAEHQGEITGHQNRLLSVVGITTTVGGVAIALGIVLATLDGWVIYFLRLPIPYLGNLLIFGVGILTAAGGVMGLVRMKK